MTTKAQEILDWINEDPDTRTPRDMEQKFGLTEDQAMNITQAWLRLPDDSDQFDQTVSQIFN